MHTHLALLPALLFLLLAQTPLHAGAQFSIEFDTSAADAEIVRGGWVLSGGQFYGTSQFSDGNILGRIYRFNPATKQIAVLHTFAGAAGGAQPHGVVEASNGLLYGTTYAGANNLGTVFRIEKGGANFTILHPYANLSGGNPSGVPIAGSDNKIYGAVESGGAFSRGGVYRIELDGTGYQLIRAHSGTAGLSPGEGCLGVVEGPGGLLYGVTATGGANNTGVIFSLEKDGDPYTLLHQFGAAGVRGPTCGLLLASDGMLYGVAGKGGAADKGGVYRIGTDGSGFRVIREFTNPADGHDSFKRLTEGSDGYLYGVAFYSANNSGSLFRLPKSGAGFVALRRFTSVPDGSQPDSPLIQFAPGIFYGTTSSGGANSSGCIFRLAASLEQPAVRVAGGRRPKFRGRILRLRGTASDELGLQRVECAAGKLKRKAVGTASWTARIPVKRSAKRLTVIVRAYDHDALASVPARIVARRQP